MNLLLPLLLACGGAEEPPAPSAALTGGAAADAVPAPTPAAAGPTPIRIGWQTTWATQGQLVAVLQHTDILEKNGFLPDWKAFTYGGPLNEGALAGAVDVLFTADQPALVLAAKDSSWGIVGRLMYNRVGAFVPADSAVQTAGDLRGKTLAVPFGAAAQREALEGAQAAGLDPAKDLTLVNLGIEEILGVVRAGAKDGRWGTIDAAAAWDPTFAEIERAGGARTIVSSVVTSVVVMDDAFSAHHPGADARFLTALAMAWDVYRADPARADRWFKEDAKLPFEAEVLTVAASVEPNLKGTTADIRIHLDDADVAGIVEAGAFMEKAGLLKVPLAVDGVIRPVARAPLAAPVDTTAVVVRP